VSFTPNAPSYTVAAGLANVANAARFPNLTADQRARIARDGFTVAPTGNDQMFYIYEENQYKGLASFITSDSVLHLYHVLYDYSLRHAEQSRFLPRMADFCGQAFAAAAALYGSAQDAFVREQALVAAAYFATAVEAFGGDVPSGGPAGASDLSRKEQALIFAASGASVSPALGVTVDYSLFKPRGHYTKSSELEDYFRGMSWLGDAAFLLEKDAASGEGGTDEALVQAALVALAIHNLPASAQRLWEGVYGATVFFVGESDDVAPARLYELLEGVYGAGFGVAELADAGKLAAYRAAVAGLPRPGVSQTGAIQMRVMGQRYIPDSEILQSLTESAQMLRPVPSGLDVMAVLGSARAKSAIAGLPALQSVSRWPGYEAEFTKVQAKFGALPQSQWTSNLYYGWLFALRPLLGAYGQGYPLFMQGEAWQDKSLAAALGSWAELRHDTVLYGKQSVAEGDGGDGEVPQAYVEPVPELYNRVLWMARAMRQGLAAQGLLEDAAKAKMENFEDWVQFLLDCSLTELSGAPLGEEALQKLLYYGAWLEYVTVSLMTDNDLLSESERNMALAVDIHSAYVDGGTVYLEEAIGKASEIYVAFPVGGEVYLGRGAVFDYYEFPSGSRLTDAEWQSALARGEVERPAWTGSYVLEGSGADIPYPSRGR
jgi:hypothetical protein